MIIEKFDVEPDIMGLGRVVIDGRYYGLPAEAVKLFAAAQAQASPDNANHHTLIVFHAL